MSTATTRQHRLSRAEYDRLRAEHQAAKGEWQEARDACTARPTGDNAARLIETWRAMVRARVAYMPEEAQ